MVVLDNGQEAIVRALGDYLKASPAIDVCVVSCPAQTHLMAVVSPAGEPRLGEAVGGGA